MEKYRVLQERPKKTYRIKVVGTVDIIAHCELEAQAILEGLVLNEIRDHDITSIRELGELEA